MEIKKFNKKLLSIQSLGIIVTKDGVNPFHKNKYATLDSIIATYYRPLTDEGLVVYHKTDLEKGHLITIIQDCDSESFIETSFPINFTGTPQNIASQLTYAKRYNFGLLLNITTDEDDDGNKASDIKEKVKSVKEIVEVQDNVNNLKTKLKEMGITSITKAQEYITGLGFDFDFNNLTDNEALIILKKIGQK